MKAADFNISGRLVFFMLVALFLALPSSKAIAYKNQIDISLSGTSGEMTVPGETFDSSYGSFGLAYTRYFKSLESGASPHALREFLQHPTRLYAGLASEGTKIEAQTRVYSDEESHGTFAVGGMYYLDRENSTGFGLTLRSNGGDGEEWDGTTLVSKQEYKGGGLELQIFQYIGADHRLELEVSSENLRAEDNSGVLIGEYDQGMLSLGVSSVINKVWLSAHLAGGTRDWKYSLSEQDVGHMDLALGYYFNRNWGLIVGLAGDSLEEGPSKESTGMFSVTGDYYFRENMHLSVSLLSRKVRETSPGIENKTREGGIGFSFGVLL